MLDVQPHEDEAVKYAYLRLPDRLDATAVAEQCTAAGKPGRAWVQGKRASESGFGVRAQGSVPASVPAFLSRASDNSHPATT